MDNKITQYKWLIVFAMLYVMILIATQLLVHKIFYFFNIYFSVAVFIFPLSFTILDIVSEVYSYETSKYILWAGLSVVFAFCIIMVGLIHLPIPSKVQHQHIYQLIFDPMLRSFIACFIAMMTGGYVNLYCISHWKILLHGRYFGLRSIGSSLIGQFIFTLIADPLTFLGTVPLHIVGTIILACYIIKMIYAFIFAIPATLCVNFLKNNCCQEKSIGQKANPFATSHSQNSSYLPYRFNSD